MQWFENEYDRAETAEYVLQHGIEQGTTEEYAPGFRQALCSVRSLGITAILRYYPYRMVYNRETAQDEPVSYPYYSMQVDYQASNHERASAVVEFDTQNANVKRASGYAKPLEQQQNPNDIWDEAMAAVDAVLQVRAQSLGRLIMPSMVVRNSGELARAS